MTPLERPSNGTDPSAANRRGRRWIGLGMLVVLAAACSIANAQVIYRWVDERNVVNFSSVPPPQIVEELGIIAYEHSQAGVAPSKDSVAPPQIRLIAKSSDESGGALRQFTGKVKNFGGATASGTAVDIVVRSFDGECGRATTQVEPADLPPGAEGNYDIKIATPCFLEFHEVDVRPRWAPPAGEASTTGTGLGDAAAQGNGAAGQF